MLKKLLTYFALLGLFASSLAFAEGRYWNVGLGGTTMKFLSMSVSPRMAGLSGAGVADPGRASEVTRNPLAMSIVNEAEFGINQMIFGEGGADNFISLYYGLPILEKFTAAFGLEFLGYDDIEGRDENGLKTADYSAYAWAGQAGFGSRNKAFNWAATARFAYQTIDDESAFAIVGDIGGSYKVMRYLAFGATLTNVGYASPYDDVDESAPMALQAGITGILPLFDRWEIHASADAYRRADYEDPEWRFGGEVTYLEFLMLRVGYAIRPQTEDGISCGIGMTFGMIVMDYGYSPRPAFEGGNHYLSLGLRF